MTDQVVEEDYGLVKFSAKVSYRTSTGYTSSSTISSTTGGVPAPFAVIATLEELIFVAGVCGFLGEAKDAIAAAITRAALSQ